MADATWMDMTVQDPQNVRDFYQAVMGWTSEPIDMGGYDDYVMKSADGSAVGGICHAKGSNALMPGGWIPYFSVADLSAALKQVIALGGSVVGERRGAGSGEFCVVKDPEGSVCALYANKG